ncbi:MAG: hypothetical protein ACXAD7_23925, partial [Candidatus Kariarchaeaceae archaeon]
MTKFKSIYASYFIKMQFIKTKWFAVLFTFLILSAFLFVYFQSVNTDEDDEEFDFTKTRSDHRYSYIYEEPTDISIKVIKIQFPDRGYIEEYDSMIAEDAVQMEEYYSEISYGLLNLTVDVSGPWYTMSNRSTEYTAALETWYGASEFIMKQAIAIADPDVDYSRYDHTIIMHTAYDYRIPNMASNVGKYTQLRYQSDDGVEMNSSSLNAIYSGTYPGVLCHEFAHQLGAVDLYDL